MPSSLCFGGELEATFEAEAQIGEHPARSGTISAPGQDDDFNVRNLTDVAESAEATTAVMTLLLGSIAACRCWWAASAS